MGSKEYHLNELRIARTPGDPQRIMPRISKHHRIVLDVGCGAGQTLIASDLDPDVVAVGVDPDHSALRLGTELDPGLKLVCAKGEGLPFAGNVFDMVISRVAMPYMHIGRTLAEISRVTRPDGELWISLHPAWMVLAMLREDASRLKWRTVLYRLYVLANGVLLHFLGRQIGVPFRQGSYESFQTERGIVRALKRAGFTHIDIDRSQCFTVRARKRI